MQSKQKQQIVERLEELVKFIEANSIGIATRNKIIEVLGRPDGCGLVRWYNEECHPITQAGELIQSVISLVAKLESRNGRFAKQFSDQQSVLDAAKTQLSAKISLLKTICNESTRTKLSKPEVAETMRQFLLKKLEQGEPFSGTPKTVAEFKARYGCGSNGTVNNVLSTDEYLRNWSQNKSVSAKSFAETYATTSAVEFLDESELESTFMAAVKKLPNEQQQEALHKFKSADKETRKQWVDAMRS